MRSVNYRVQTANCSQSCNTQQRGILLSDEKRAWKILLHKDQFVLLGDVLYHIGSDVI